MDKPHALRLANALERGWLENVDRDAVDVAMIQEELRRLHQVNQDLVEALETIAEYWSKKNSPDDYEHSQQEYETACLHSVKTAATVLAKHKEQV